ALALSRYRFWTRLDVDSLSPEATRDKLFATFVIVPAIGAVSTVLLMFPPLLYGTMHDAHVMISCIMLGTVICGICYVILPYAAVTMFATVFPSLLVAAVWYGSLALLAMAALYVVAAALGSQAILRQFAIVARLVESEDEAASSMRAAAQADRAKADFLANMSHEIRTPMNGVLGMAELLARSNPEMSQKSYVDVIVKSGNTLLSTINDILDYSRLEAGRLVLDPEPFRLGDAVEDVVQMHTQRVREKDLEIIQRIDPYLPEYLVGDAGRFRQILAYLIGNAVKFTEFGHILIDVSAKVEKGSAEIRLRVQDTGCGIPGEKLPTIFDTFQQADTSSTRRHDGAGLGLAVAARLVHLMDGQIGVESEAGEGSTFWITLPMPIHEVVETPHHLPRDVTGARVLVIDDNEVNRTILLEQLHSWDLEAAAVEGGLLGLAFIEEASRLDAPVDCVILDYQMPGMNGVDVARRLRSEPAYAHLPLVILSSVDQGEFVGLPFDLGNSVRLTKPARSNELREAVMDLIRRTRATTAGEPAATRKAAPMRLVTGETAKVDLLIVEDNPLGQTLLRQFAVEAGFSYQMAANPRAALQTADRPGVRVVLIDDTLPGDGADGLARTLRARHNDIAILTMGRHAGHDTGDLYDGHLEKPVSPARFSALVRALLHNGMLSKTA
ncbi:MAG: response regulator, partial [Brucellaceae bacterium]|nr:response regulator [Brucellaceae bacterium]